MKHIVEFRQNQVINILFFSKMSAIIQGISLSEVFFPCSEAHDSRSSIMVTASDEGMKDIIASGTRNIVHGLCNMRLVFGKYASGKMELLPVHLPRLIYLVKTPCLSRYHHQPGKDMEKIRRIESRRYQQMRYAFYADSMHCS